MIDVHVLPIQLNYDAQYSFVSNVYKRMNPSPFIRLTPAVPDMLQ